MGEEIVFPPDGFQAVAWSGFDDGSKKRFLTAYRAFVLAWPRSAHVPIGFYVLPADGEHSGIWCAPGWGMNLYREIWLRAASERRLPPEHMILRGLIRCARCCSMGCGRDESVLSQLRQAERDLARLADAISEQSGSRTVIPVPRFVTRIHQVK